MIQLGIGDDKRLYLVAGASYAGDKGTTGSVALPTYFGGVAVSEFAVCSLYIKYGGDSAAYEEIELDGLSGTQTFDISDEVFANAGQITIWGEFSDTDGTVVQKTGLLFFVVGASETYVEPQSGGGGEA